MWGLLGEFQFEDWIYQNQHMSSKRNEFSKTIGVYARKLDPEANQIKPARPHCHKFQPPG